MSPVDPKKVERAVQAAGRTRVDHRDRTGATDLSPAAIAARKQQPDGGATGRELVDRAARVFGEAKRLAKVATKRNPGPRREKASARADDALRTAATQIRIAQCCPLDRGYLHALDLERIQTIKAEVGEASLADPGALAIDTHRRIIDQRQRISAEG